MIPNVVNSLKGGSGSRSGSNNPERSAMQSALSLNGGPAPHHPATLGPSSGTSMVMNAASTTSASMPVPSQTEASLPLPVGFNGSSGSASPGRKRKYDDPAAVVVMHGAQTIHPGQQPQLREFGRPPPIHHQPSPASSIRPAPSQVPKPGFPTAQGSIMPRPLSATISSMGPVSHASRPPAVVVAGPIPVPTPPASTSSNLVAAQQGQPPQVLTTQQGPAQPTVVAAPPVKSHGNFMMLTLKKMEEAQAAKSQEQQQSQQLSQPSLEEQQPSADPAGNSAKVVVAAEGKQEEVEEEEEAEERPTLEQRRQIMDETIVRIKADIEILRREGLTGKLLTLLGERIVEEREKARTDALRHKAFLTYSTEQIQKHQVEEAETNFRVSLENVREQMVDERVHQIKRLEESIRTGVPLEEVVISTRAGTRHTRSRVKDGDALLDKIGNSGVGVAKRRRGQSPVSAFLQKTLKVPEMERDICEIVADDEFAMHDSDDEDMDGRPNIRVRVERNSLVYTDQVFYKGDQVILTVARTDEQIFGTLQQFNLDEIQVKITTASSTSRKRVALSELSEGTMLLEKAPDMSSNGRQSGGLRDGWDEDYIPPRSSRRG